MDNAVVIMLIGLPIGILMGLTSFTGAIIVPSLVLLWGVAQAKAQGTSVLLTMSPLQVPAMWNFYRAGNIDWRWAVSILKKHDYDGTITPEVFSPDRELLLASTEKLRQLWAETTAAT